VTHYLLALALSMGALFSPVSASAQETAPKDPRPRILVLYSLSVENDHALFALDALKFFARLAENNNFVMDSSSKWEELNDASLKSYNLVVWLNQFPHNQSQREAFEKYMTGGGAWLGFHVSAYNDKNTKWPWFLDFIGGGVFDMNNWPPLPAKLVVNDRTSPVTRNLPETFESPTNEWYRWKPSPREGKNIHVLVTIDPANYPLGIRNLLTYGDIPVVWTNTNYKMLYMNMGHGDKIFASPVQNTLIENATLWLLGKN
jgi:type 1 glutamine amidotransferase